MTTVCYVVIAANCKAMFI